MKLFADHTVKMFKIFQLNSQDKFSFLLYCVRFLVRNLGCSSHFRLFSVSFWVEPSSQQVIPPWAYEHEHQHHGPVYHHSAGPGPELIYTKPPTGHPADYLHGATTAGHQHFHNDWDFTGPGLGAE